MDFTRHSPAATTSPTCKSSETSSEEVASSMLNKPWTIRVVSAHHRHDSAHKQRGTDRAGHLTCDHEKPCPRGGSDKLHDNNDEGRVKHRKTAIEQKDVSHLRNKEDEPEQTVTDQAGEPSSAYLRRNVAEDKPERMGVAGEGADVDRARPTAARGRASSFPIRAAAWPPTPEPQAPQRSTNSPSAPHRTFATRGPMPSCLLPCSSTPCPSQLILYLQRNTKRQRLVIADPSSCDL